MNRFVFSMLLFVAVFMALAGSLCLAAGQSKLASEDEPTKEEAKPKEKPTADLDFKEARAKREKLQEEYPKLIKEKEDLEAKLAKFISEYKTAVDQLKRTTLDLKKEKENLDNAKKEIPVNQNKVNLLKDRVDKYEIYLKEDQASVNSFTKDDFINFNNNINKKKSEIANNRLNYSVIENRLTSLLDVEKLAHDFKKKICYTFAGLVGFVILGFFAVAWQDEKVRQAVFSGHEGLQLITLFSLVIAIILFGIMGILEGKELAALLGGLSGYILGRSTQPSPSSPPPAPAPALAPPPTPAHTPAPAPAPTPAPAPAPTPTPAPPTAQVLGPSPTNPK